MSDPRRSFALWRPWSDAPHKEMSSGPLWISNFWRVWALRLDGGHDGGQSDRRLAGTPYGRISILAGNCVFQLMPGLPPRATPIFTVNAITRNMAFAESQRRIGRESSCEHRRGVGEHSERIPAVLSSSTSYPRCLRVMHASSRTTSSAGPGWAGRTPLAVSLGRLAGAHEMWCRRRANYGRQ